MQAKDKNIKTICPENVGFEKMCVAPVRLPAEVVAKVAGVSQSLVKKVRSGAKDTDTPGGKRIEVAEELWSEGSSLLLNEIKKIVKL